jgi:hypothetical protein
MAQLMSTDAISMYLAKGSSVTQFLTKESFLKADKTPVLDDLTCEALNLLLNLCSIKDIYVQGFSSNLDKGTLEALLIAVQEVTFPEGDGDPQSGSNQKQIVVAKIQQVIQDNYGQRPLYGVVGA